MKNAAEGRISVRRSVFAGLTSSVMAAMSDVLQITEPMALPNEIAPLPAMAPCAETMTSGSVVPMETTVAPMSSSGM